MPYIFKVAYTQAVELDKHQYNFIEEVAKSIILAAIGQHKDLETTCVLGRMNLNGDKHKFSYQVKDYENGRGITWLKLPLDSGVVSEQIRKGELKHSRTKKKRLMVSSKEISTQSFYVSPCKRSPFLEETTPYFGDSTMIGPKTILCKFESSSVCKLLFGAFILNFLAEPSRNCSFFGLLAQWKWHPPEEFHQAFKDKCSNLYP